MNVIRDSGVFMSPPRAAMKRLKRSSEMPLDNALFKAGGYVSFENYTVVAPVVFPVARVSARGSYVFQHFVSV